MQDAHGHTVPATFAEMMVAVGRIEEKLTRIERLENRLGIVEEKVTHLDATKPNRTPFVNWLTAGAAAMAMIVGGVSLQAQYSTQLATQAELQMLKTQQNKLTEKVNP